MRSNWNQVSIRLWLGYIAVFTHWSGLLWAWFGTRNDRRPISGSWIEAYTTNRPVSVGGEPLTAQRLAEDVPTLYLRSVYWATITMTTVGYGDITPSSSLADGEFAVAMGVMLAGLVLYLLLSAEFTTLISNSSRQGEEFRTVVEQTRRYLAYRHVPAGLRKRVRAYFALRWKRTRGFSETAVINDMPRSLALDVRVELYKGLLDRVPLFKGVEDTFVRQLVKLVTLEFYMPDEYIIRKDDVGKEMFFIQRGICHVVADDEVTPLFTLPTGSFFGEIALVLSERRSASVAAGTACDILVLHRRDLFLTLNDYPDVASLLSDFARRRLAERKAAEEEKMKADELRERTATMLAEQQQRAGTSNPAAPSARTDGSSGRRGSLAARLSRSQTAPAMSIERHSSTDDDEERERPRCPSSCAPTATDWSAASRARQFAGSFAESARESARKTFGDSAGLSSRTSCRYPDEQGGPSNTSGGGGDGGSGGRNPLYRRVLFGKRFKSAAVAPVSPASPTSSVGECSMHGGSDCDDAEKRGGRRAGRRGTGASERALCQSTLTPAGAYPKVRHRRVSSDSADGSDRSADNERPRSFKGGVVLSSHSSPHGSPMLSRMCAHDGAIQAAPSRRCSCDPESAGPPDLELRGGQPGSQQMRDADRRGAAGVGASPCLPTRRLSRLATAAFSAADDTRRSSGQRSSSPGHSSGDGAAPHLSVRSGAVRRRARAAAGDGDESPNNGSYRRKNRGDHDGGGSPMISPIAIKAAKAQVSSDSNDSTNDEGDEDDGAPAAFPNIMTREASKCRRASFFTTTPILKRAHTAHVGGAGGTRVSHRWHDHEPDEEQPPTVEEHVRDAIAKGGNDVAVSLEAFMVGNACGACSNPLPLFDPVTELGTASSPAMLHSSGFHSSGGADSPTLFLQGISGIPGVSPPLTDSMAMLTAAIGSPQVSSCSPLNLAAGIGCRNGAPRYSRRPSAMHDYASRRSSTCSTDSSFDGTTAHRWLNKSAADTAHVAAIVLRGVEAAPADGDAAAADVSAPVFLRCDVASGARSVTSKAPAAVAGSLVEVAPTAVAEGLIVVPDGFQLPPPSDPPPSPPEAEVGNSTHSTGSSVGLWNGNSVASACGSFDVEETPVCECEPTDLSHPPRPRGFSVGSHSGAGSEGGKSVGSGSARLDRGNGSGSNSRKSSCPDGYGKGDRFTRRTKSKEEGGGSFNGARLVLENVPGVTSPATSSPSSHRKRPDKDGGPKPSAPAEYGGVGGGCGGLVAPPKAAARNSQAKADKVAAAQHTHSEREGMDAATFINTRPWVRSAPTSASEEQHNVAEGKTANFWDPDGLAATSFDTCGAALNYVNMSILPIICFVYREIQLPLMLALLVFDGWTALDMTLNLRGKRPYHEPHTGLVTDRAAIRRKYLRTRLPIDLISSVPYELLGYLGASSLGLAASTIPFLRLRVVLRFYRVRLVLLKLEDSFELQGYVAICRLLLLIFLSVHWLACVWLWLGVDDGWARVLPLHAAEMRRCDADRYDGCWGLYVKSLYWVITTLITVGYGDIFPTTNQVFAHKMNSDCQ